MPTIKRCDCTHTDRAHNTQGCKILNCPCRKYKEASITHIEVDRRDNY